MSKTGPTAQELENLLELLSPSKPKAKMKTHDAKTPLMRVVNGDGTETQSAQDTSEIILYGRRWGMLLVVGSLQMANAMNWFTYAPVAVTAAQHYGTTTATINWLSMLFMIAFVPFVFPSSWMLSVKGLRKALVFFSFLNMVGAGLRYGAEYLHTAELHLIGQFVGQFFCAVAQPAIMGCPTLLASMWFGDSERATANTLITLFNPVGIAIASAVFPMLVNCNPDNMKLPLLATTGFSAFGFILTLAFMQSKPPTRCSFSSDADREDFFEALKTLSKNRQYLMLCGAFGLGTGVFNGVSTLLAQVITGQGYSETNAGLASAALIGAGLLGAMMSGVLLDCTGKFVPLMRGAFVLGGSSLAIFAYFVKPYETNPDELTTVILTSALLGFGFFSTLPLTLELGVELTYPVPEGTSASLLWLFGNFFGFPITLAMVALESDPINTTQFDINGTSSNSTDCDGGGEIRPMKNSVWLGVGCIFLAVLLVLPISTSAKLHRRESELLQKKLGLAASESA